MVCGNHGVERSLRQPGDEFPQRGGGNPLSPVLPAIPVGDLAQALAHKASDIPDDNAIALHGALDGERVREDPRPVDIEIRALT
jgi:hypothetical protein